MAATLLPVNYRQILFPISLVSRQSFDLHRPASSLCSCKALTPRMSDYVFHRRDQTRHLIMSVTRCSLFLLPSSWHLSPTQGMNLCHQSKDSYCNHWCLLKLVNIPFPECKALLPPDRGKKKCMLLLWCLENLDKYLDKTNLILFLLLPGMWTSLYSAGHIQAISLLRGWTLYLT